LEEATQVLGKAVKNVRSGYLRLAKLAHFLVQHTNNTSAKRALYHFIKLGCKVAEHHPDMKACSDALVPVLQDYMQELKEKGKNFSVENKFIFPSECSFIICKFTAGSDLDDAGRWAWQFQKSRVLSKKVLSEKGLRLRRGALENFQKSHSHEYRPF